MSVYKSKVSFYNRNKIIKHPENKSCPIPSRIEEEIIKSTTSKESKTSEMLALSNVIKYACISLIYI